MRKLFRLLLIFLLSGLILALGGMLALTLYYRSNFPVNTWINGVYCTGKSIEQVNEELVSAQEASVITIVDADCVNWEIDMLAADIRPDYSDALKAYLKKNASAFWMDNLKSPVSSNLMPEKYIADEEKLLACFLELPFVAQEQEKTAGVRVCQSPEGFELQDGNADRLNLEKACAYVGVDSLSYELPENTAQEELLSLIGDLNGNSRVSGILVQLPLPHHIDEEKILLAIDPRKDVDGFHPYNVGLLSIGNAVLKACTPAGCIELIKRSGIEIIGKKCVVIGRSNIVGKPVSMLLLAENGTVSVCHSKTRDINEEIKNADIVIAAVGKPKFVKGDMISDGAVIIDVGINRMENGKLCGDVDFENVAPKCGAITPVPGGVGPMTIAMLMANCVEGM